MKEAALGAALIFGLAGCVAGGGQVELAGSSADRTDRYKATAGALTHERAVVRATKMAAFHCAKMGLAEQIVETSSIATVANAKHARVVFQCRPGVPNNVDAGVTASAQDPLPPSTQAP